MRIYPVIHRRWWCVLAAALLFTCGENLLAPGPDTGTLNGEIGLRLAELERAAESLDIAATAGDVPAVRDAWRATYRWYLETVPVAEPVVGAVSPLLVRAINTLITDAITPPSGFHVIASILYDRGTPRSHVDLVTLAQQASTLHGSLRSFTEIFHNADITPALVFAGMEEAVEFLEVWADTLAAPDYPSGTLQQDVGSIMVGFEIAYHYFQPLVLASEDGAILDAQVRALVAEARDFAERPDRPIPEDILGVAEGLEEGVLGAMALLFGALVE